MYGVFTYISIVPGKHLNVGKVCHPWSVWECYSIPFTVQTQDQTQPSCIFSVDLEFSTSDFMDLPLSPHRLSSCVFSQKRHAHPTATSRRTAMTGRRVGWTSDSCLTMTSRRFISSARLGSAAERENGGERRSQPREGEQLTEVGRRSKAGRGPCLGSPRTRTRVSNLFKRFHIEEQINCLLMFTPLAKVGGEFGSPGSLQSSPP